MKQNTIYNKIKNNIDNKIIIIDFDHTITTKNSETSIGVFNRLLNMEYVTKKRKIDNKVSKNTIILTYYWYKKIKLLKKYIKRKYIKESINYFKPNKEIIDLLNETNSKIIICSSGYKDIIKEFLYKYKIRYNYLLANTLNSNIFNVITPNNKYRFVKKITNNLNNKKYILIGDMPSDNNMIKSNNKIFYQI